MTLERIDTEAVAEKWLQQCGPCDAGLPMGCVLDITGRHDLIGEDGDGDWGAVWDHLYELPAKAWDEGSHATAYSGVTYTDNPYRVTATASEGT